MPLPSAPPRYEYNSIWSHELDRRLAEARGVPRSFIPESLYTFRTRVAVGLAGEAVDTFTGRFYPNLKGRATVRLSALECALFAIAACKSFENVGFLHPTKTDTKKIPKRYKRAPFSYPLLGEVLRDLADGGYLELHKGFKLEGYKDGVTTLWLPTKRGRTIVQAILAQGVEVVPLLENRELVILKDEDGELEKYVDTASTRELRSLLVATNTARQAFKWDYQPINLPETKELRGRRLYSNSFEVENDDDVWVFDSERAKIEPVDLECRRIFKGSFSSGGRFYCEAQSLRKLERATVEIGGKATVELDFKSHQARILYHFNGLDSPVDCYDIPGQPRELWKHIAMLAMNCKNEEQALRNLQDKHDIPWEEGRRLIAAYRERHEDVSDSLFSQLWGELQFADSELTRAILAACLEQGIPVLPIHDSYITTTEHIWALKCIMERCYFDAFGFEARIGGFEGEYGKASAEGPEGHNSN